MLRELNSLTEYRTLFYPDQGWIYGWALWTIVLLSLANTFYAYFGYPLILKLLTVLPGLKRGPIVVPITGPYHPKISIIISARNEERVISEKLENTLKLKYAGTSLPNPNVQIIVASDCSDDNTDAIVRSFSKRGVILQRTETRGGKEAAQKFAVEHSSGDIIIFTDAKVILDELVIDNFIQYFRDPTVGAVSSTDRVIGSEDGSGEGFYVKYEMWLRRLESEYSGLIGLSGSCFAVRKKIALKIRTDVPSDFSLIVATKQSKTSAHDSDFSLTISTQKYLMRGVHGPDVIAYYKEVTGERKEFERKVRTVLRGMTALWHNRNILNPFRFGLFAWQMFSHKVSRWLVPLSLLLAATGSIPLAENILFFRLLALGILCFCLLAFLGAIIRPLRRLIIVKIPLFFLVVNFGIAVAALRFLFGQTVNTWDPSEKGS